MATRLISAFAGEIRQMDKVTLKESIRASEGRVVCSENICTYPTAGRDITNAEIARAMGADLILMNMLDVFDPVVEALPPSDRPVEMLKDLVGKPIGVNLEPVDEEAHLMETACPIREGRKATVETLVEASRMGFDFVCLTGNPATGVTHRAIVSAIVQAKKYFSGLIFAGKMHGAGVDESWLEEKDVAAMMDAGADVLLVPVPGTVPGITEEMVHSCCRRVHAQGGLVMSTIGTSQESASPEVIRALALSSKRCGVDIHHIGDAGYGGLANYLNILELSRAIRGDRHTIHTMAASIRR